VVQESNKKCYKEQGSCVFLVDVACRFVDAKVWLVQHVALLNSFKF
jgi:hypothetical protein